MSVHVRVVSLAIRGDLYICHMDGVSVDNASQCRRARGRVSVHVRVVSLAIQGGDVVGD